MALPNDMALPNAISGHHHAAIYERLYNTPTISSRPHRSPPRQRLNEELLTAASFSEEEPVQEQKAKRTNGAYNEL